MNGWYFWSEGTASYYRDNAGSLEQRNGAFAIFYAGADYLVAENVALGFMLEFDRASEHSGVYSDLQGSGWMIGPYATVELAPNVYASLRAAWGRSENTAFVDVLGFGPGFHGSFDTRRELYLGSIQAAFTLAKIKVSPVAELAYYRESQGDFSVSDGSRAFGVAGGTTELGRLSVASAFEWTLPNALNMPLAFVRPQMNWNLQGGGFADELEPFSASLEVGIKTDATMPWQGEISVRLDGIGAAEFEGVSARVYLSKDF